MDNNRRAGRQQALRLAGAAILAGLGVALPIGSNPANAQFASCESTCGYNYTRCGGSSPPWAAECGGIYKACMAGCSKQKISYTPKPAYSTPSTGYVPPSTYGYAKRNCALTSYNGFYSFVSTPSHCMFVSAQPDWRRAYDWRAAGYTPTPAPGYSVVAAPGYRSYGYRY